jgi:hypothetical protein
MNSQTERSFLAGETESVFEITNWDSRVSFITDLEMAYSYPVAAT